MAEGPFDHVVDCSTGLAIDWTLTPEQEELRCVLAAEQARRRLHEERQASARRSLTRLTRQGSGLEPVSRGDLRDLVCALGWDEP